MASTYLYAGDVVPADIVLRSVIDDTSVYYLSPVITPIFLYPGEETDSIQEGNPPDSVTLQLRVASGTDIYLYGVLDGVPTTLRIIQSTDIILSDPTVPRETGGETYYGVLRVWNGALWAAKTLKVYMGSWNTKPLKRYSGTEWLLVQSN